MELPIIGFFNVGVALMTTEERSICHALKLNFLATNNEAKYEALALKLTRKLGVETLHILCDYWLVVYRVREDYSTRGQHLAPHPSWVQQLLVDFDNYTITHLLEGQNEKTKSLAKLASFGDARQKDFIPVEMLIIPSIDI